MSTKYRAARIAPLLDMIKEIYRQKQSVEIIDIGGTEDYWNLVATNFLEENNVTLTVINVPGAEKAEDKGRFKFICADGCDLNQFAENKFDIAHSNSVIEHVGDWPRMKAFAKEVNRVARFYFVQTPNYWFPIEPHFKTFFFHWLPTPVRIWMVIHFQLGSYRKAQSYDEAVNKIEDARLLNYKMLKHLFVDGDIIKEKFCLLNKSFIAVKKP